MTAAVPTSSAEVPDPAHFVGALGIELWHETGRTRGRMEIRPEMWVPGTTQPRMGLLATAVDVVGGIPAAGPINPTIDLRLRLLSTPPASGMIELECRPVKAGRRLFVGEVPIHAAGAEAPFARSTVTFMNEPLPREPSPPSRPRPVLGMTFDELVGAVHVDEATVAVDLRPELGNSSGTVQGGVQAFLAELAAERALEPEGRFVVTDLEIRYVNRVRRGPLVARAEVLSRGSAEVDLRVALTEAGDDDRTVSLASMTCRPAQAARQRLG